MLFTRFMESNSVPVLGLRALGNKPLAHQGQLLPVRCPQTFMVGHGLGIGMMRPAESFGPQRPPCGHVKAASAQEWRHSSARQGIDGPHPRAMQLVCPWFWPDLLVNLVPQGRATRSQEGGAAGSFMEGSSVGLPRIREWLPSQSCTTSL